MAFSLSEMVAGASKAASEAGSIFKNPAQAGTNSISSTQLGIDYLMAQVIIADPTYVPPTYPNPDPVGPPFISLSQHITGSVASITSAIYEKTLNVAQDLKIALIASDHQQAAKAIDAITSKNLAAMPNQIAVKFPDVTATQNTVMDTAFTPLTGAAPHMDAAAATMAAEFNNIGFMVPFFTAMNAIPGVIQMTTGEALLKYIGNTTDKTLIDAAFISCSTSLDFIIGLKTAFSNTGTHTTTMATGFSTIVDGAKAAMATATSIIGGNQLVSMLSSPNAFVQSILGKVVNTSTLDLGAIDLKNAVESNKISLPAGESLAISAKGSVANVETISDNIVPAVNIIAPVNSSYVPYTITEINEFSRLTNVQLDICKSVHKQAAEWVQTNLEDWKVSTGYRAAKVQAGYTKDAPFGTTTDPAILESWRIQLTECRRRTAEYEAGIGAIRAREYTKHDEMSDEWVARSKYGKYPYTYQESIGTQLNPSDKTTHLDTTK